MVNVQLLSVVFGFLVASACILVYVSRRQAYKEFTDTATKTRRTNEVRPKRSFSYTQVLREDAAAIGEEEKAGQWVRMAIIGATVLLACAVLLRMPAIAILVPLVFLAPIIYAKTLRASFVRVLKGQTRIMEVVMAFLMKSGATLTDTLNILEQRLGAPMKDRLREVNAKKRYLTLPGALEDVSDSTGVVRLREFATLISESERYGTPVAEALMRHIKLDIKMRDRAAAERNGNVQLEMSMYALILIALPGFSFVLYAMLSFALHMFGTSFAVG